MTDIKKLGFCFLIYDIINLEELWYKFFKGVDSRKYGIYIHYKTNKPLKYFESNKINQCIPTQYGGVTLIHAHNLIFKAAYDDGCYKIISLSQACIPLKSFRYIYNALTKDNLSHFNTAPQNQCFPRCNSLIPIYPLEHIQKSSNWFILNRRGFEESVKKAPHDIDKIFGNVLAAEEHYFIMCMYSGGLLDQIVEHKGPCNEYTTFTNWGGDSYPWPSTKWVKEYTTIGQQELLFLLFSSSCLFGRKFQPECYESLNHPTYLDFVMTKS